MRPVFLILFAVTIAVAGWYYSLHFPAERVYTPSQQEQMVETYVRQHITQLSPEPAVLGGRFYVTSFQFTGPGKARVQYEDGHNAYSARFDYGLGADGRVIISHFRF